MISPLIGRPLRIVYDKFSRFETSSMLISSHWRSAALLTSATVSFECWYQLDHDRWLELIAYVERVDETSAKLGCSQWRRHISSLIA
jgi:hypothetical protein